MGKGLGLREKRLFELPSYFMGKSYKNITFQPLWHNCEKRLKYQSCPSVRIPHTQAGLPLDEFPLYLILWTSFKSLVRLHIRLIQDKNNGQFARRPQYGLLL